MSASSTLVRPSVAIILVNWNGWRECIECIDSVLAQEFRDFHVFIVDNDSQDSSIEHVIEWCNDPKAYPEWHRQQGTAHYTDRAPRSPVSVRLMNEVSNALPGRAEPRSVTLMRAGANLGYAGGCNVGIRAAGVDNYDYFWLLNPDTVVQRRALLELLAHAQAQPGMGIVGSTLLYYDSPDTVFALAGGRINRSNGCGVHIGQGALLASLSYDVSAVERELSWVCGASMLVSSAFIREVGLMQEDYFLYYEEADWAMRGLTKFRLGFARHSVVYHKSGANSSKIMPLFTAGFYYRSRLRFVHRFFPDRMTAARRRLLVEMLKHLARGRWSSARLVVSTLLWTPPA
jgi:GT2 family glycosyltransferase